MLDLAEHAADCLASMGGIEVLDEPELSVVVCRATDGDATTQSILDALLITRGARVEYHDRR